MNPLDQDYPWVFHRDELDLLEDEMEDLYDRYHAQSSNGSSFESVILTEQLEIEEESDKILSLRLGLESQGDVSEGLLSSRSGSDSSETDAWQQEVPSLRSHALYQQSKKWMERVKPFAKNAYEKGGGYAGEFFRVYIHSNLVPLKVFTALGEEVHEDQMGLEIAEEEYRLAILYLTRVLDSLSLMAFHVEVTQWVETCRRQTEALREVLSAQLTALKRRKGSLL
ncbi:hypothetical protein COV05_00430 [Candidatus Uhrbacteria bacterium CG10_big_fil_rev_8_21_14_0_10_48_16]|uniref:Uncharacterized protein n=1 Tax=Candidatus Uhrbacteria bacterium CG10_big_fil_rev_8_21_14_0_10_48_16 TaxID=1975038 RepID=A0A2M8LIF7_9BACT|nr:MAG: hypothetical protein COV05_00430 [Candidatus Uhrbacteria bacterium CG10_big_fil_rev_8_21_14_0_10_48_16]